MILLNIINASEKGAYYQTIYFVSSLLQKS